MPLDEGVRQTAEWQRTQGSQRRTTGKSANLDTANAGAS